jgi:hypothetical protein
MKLWSRKTKTQTEFNPYPLAHALTSARQFMQPMDFFQILFETGDFKKMVSIGFIKSYFVESIHVGIDGFSDEMSQSLFGPLFEAGFNPSEDGLHYYAEWLPEAEGERQFCLAFEAIKASLGLQTISSFQVLGDKFLEQELEATEGFKSLPHGRFAIVEP